ncbi:MAG TPA: L,D-transpeptidase [Gemmatimonadaceae bacterium]|nr:L,D-transpeptidase [Gemmatimonadaceae bacterium]
MSDSSDAPGVEAALGLPRGRAYRGGQDRLRTRVRVLATFICATTALLPAALSAQEKIALAGSPELAPRPSPPLESAPPTRADSLAADAARAAAAADRRLRILVSIAERRLAVVNGADTLMTAPAAVGMDRRLTYDGRSWTFRSPRGVRFVTGRTARDSWIPPDWHYAEVAREYHLRLARLRTDSAVVLDDGSILTTRDRKVGLVRRDGGFAPLPVDEEIVFDGTLYVPPPGTENRAITGELGEYQLDLGGGYLIHGTPHQNSIGTATTHGCVRLDDEQIAWLYDHIPIGTPVYIY